MFNALYVQFNINKQSELVFFNIQSSDQWHNPAIRTRVWYSESYLKIYF